LNGIDTDVWNAAIDPLVPHKFDAKTVTKGKQKNKELLCTNFGLDPKKPLFIFIGRLVSEKAADILPTVLGESVEQHQGNLSFLVLGSGDPQVESELASLAALLPAHINCYIGYNEALAHHMYAAADFLLMPSRVEPCGLNQMYALRYATVPMVRNTGGLRDTVIDIAAPEFAGYGLVFENATVWDVNQSINRAMGWYYDRPDILEAARKKMVAIDNSWESSAQQYIDVYSS
jgi:starch synthase